MTHFLDIQVSDELLTRVRAGDVSAYEQVYASFSRPVYTLLRRLVVRPAVAEELLQDVFVEILRSVRNYSGAGSFAGWVRSIAVSKALMHLRSPWHRRLLPIGDEELHLVDQSHPEPWSDGLQHALNALPAVSRSVVWLHDVEGYTHGEIARLFGRTPSFSKSQLARAHEQLRDLLEPQAGGLPCMPVIKS
ncbi:MAG: RNA polymerase sigma factor [Steroidobacteraceae bacterium]